MARDFVLGLPAEAADGAIVAAAVRDAANAQRPAGAGRGSVVVQDFCVFKDSINPRPKICRGMRKRDCPSQTCGKIRLSSHRKRIERIADVAGGGIQRVYAAIGVAQSIPLETHFADGTKLLFKSRSNVNVSEACGTMAKDGFWATSPGWTAIEAAATARVGCAWQIRQLVSIVYRAKAVGVGVGLREIRSISVCAGTNGGPTDCRHPRERSHGARIAGGFSWAMRLIPSRNSDSSMSLTVRSG